MPHISSFFQMTPEEVLVPLRVLHRAPDGYIAFGRKDEGGVWQNLFSYRLNQLDEVLPEVLYWLERDAYFSVNAMYRASGFLNPLTNRPRVVRSQSALRYLNACYVDLDVGREQSLASDGSKLTWREAWMTITDLIAEGRLPQCSMVARSGRGAYAFWLLEGDDDPALPPHAFPEKIRFYQQLNRLLTQKLASLYADPQTSDAARVLRVPGTKHSASGEIATYSIQSDPDGQPFSYTLDQLMTELSRERPLFWLLGPKAFTRPQPPWIEVEETGRFAIPLYQEYDSGFYDAIASKIIVDKTARGSASAQNHGDDASDVVIPQNITPEVQVFGRATKNPKSALGRYKGAIALNQWRGKDLIRVHQRRRGWAKGQRRRSLSLLALCLRNANEEKPFVFYMLEWLAKECRPPYPSDPNDESLMSIVERTFSGPLKKITTQKILNAVGITDAEIRKYNLRTLVSDTVRAERQLPPGGLREQRRIQRREFIRNYLQQNGMVSCRDLARELKRAGILVSQQTVNEDLRLLLNQSGVKHQSIKQPAKPKIKTRKSLARKKAGRPRQAPSSNPEDLLSPKLWERISPLLPLSSKAHPLGCHRPRVDDRVVMSAILFVLRKGSKWSDLNANGLCTSSTAHRRFKEWQKAGIFEQLHQQLSEEASKINADVLSSADWNWLAKAVGTCGPDGISQPDGDA